MFLNKRTLFGAIAATGAAFMLAGCTNDLTESSSSAAVPSAPDKIANSAADAQGGILIVKFNESSVEAIEHHAEHAAATRSAVTRSGIAGVDCILDEIGVESFERVFRVGKDEERTRAAGLHRWYVLRFAPERDLEEAARLLSDAAEITTIQYNTLVHRADAEVYPLSAEGGEAGVQTRAMVRSEFNDPQLKWQWHYINNGDEAVADKVCVGADINVAEAWKLTAGDPRVIVAVVDGGVKHTHPDLAANMWVNLAELYGRPGVDDDGNGYVDDIYGYNFVTDSGQITWNEKGDASHGTHVAGTVAAVNNNGLGVAGVAGGTGHNDGARIMSCQIFAGERDSGDYHTALAIKYAADNGASILQCSYGMTVNYYSDETFRSIEPLVVEALDYFRGTNNCEALDGGLIIYAAGNNSLPAASYPAAYRNVIAVTAFSADFLPAYYTNYHLGCNIAAPGGEISSSFSRGGVLSTVCSELDSHGDDYGYIQGTSMACPHVSGVAALGLAYALKRGKHFTNDEFVNMILTSVNDIDSRMEGIKSSSGVQMDLEKDYRGRMGSGAIDAYRLLMQIEGTPCLTVARNQESLLSLKEHFGGGADNLTYVEGSANSSSPDLERYGVEMTEEDMEKLGVVEKPRIVNGRLQIKCTKIGCAKVKVRAIAGGERAGTEAHIGGIPVIRDIAIIVRETGSNRWL